MALSNNFIVVVVLAALALGCAAVRVPSHNCRDDCRIPFRPDNTTLGDRKFLKLSSPKVVRIDKYARGKHPTIE